MTEKNKKVGGQDRYNITLSESCVRFLEQLIKMGRADNRSSLIRELVRQEWERCVVLYEPDGDARAAIKAALEDPTLPPKFRKILSRMGK